MRFIQSQMQFPPMVLSQKAAVTPWERRTTIPACQLARVMGYWRTILLSKHPKQNLQILSSLQVDSTSSSNSRIQQALMGKCCPRLLVAMALKPWRAAMLRKARCCQQITRTSLQLQLR